MERQHLVKYFSRRLVTLMINFGFTSSNSKAGVKVSKLAEISGCSIQMARRYVLGEALPDIDITYKIAKWLKVSPGWLLFGDEEDIPNNLYKQNLIQIEPELLEHILMKSSFLFELLKVKAEVVGFIMDIINDVTHLEADKKTVIKVIDMSIDSTIRFNGFTNDKIRSY